MPTASRDMTIVNDKGLHARAATAFVKVANGYASDITVTRGSTIANGKQIMMLLILAAPKGSTITVEAAGDDAQAALDALDALVGAGFGE